MAKSHTVAIIRPALSYHDPALLQFDGVTKYRQLKPYLGLFSIHLDDVIVRVVKVLSSGIIRNGQARGRKPMALVIHVGKPFEVRDTVKPKLIFVSTFTKSVSVIFIRTI